jgi:hypothetical protein
MPKMTVACEALGFDPSASNILWRLQTLYVVGRYKKVSRGTTPHYKSRVLSLGDAWTGTSRAGNFVLFGDDVNVNYDNRTDRVAGGHAILTVAAQPAGSGQWLQDYVHLRILGSNPTETIVRKYVRDALARRDPNLELIADAVFAWENAMQQFDPRVRTGETYKRVKFAWPQDPANFPAVAFDFGVGLGQFTHPGEETVGVCWDWRDNLDAGINELLDDLRATFKADQSFIDWAKNAWSMYNTGKAGSSPYATRLAKSSDGKKIDGTAVPSGFDRKGETAHVAGRPAAPAPGPWPVPETLLTDRVGSPQLSKATDAIIATVSDKVRDPHLLAWMWPKLEQEVVGHVGHGDFLAFPGMHQSGLNEHLANLDQRSRRQASDAAFAHLWEEARASHAPSKGKRGTSKRKRSEVGPTAIALQSASASGAAFAAKSGNLSAEFQSLIPSVRDHVDHGISGWALVRERMFKLFGAAGDPAKAIPRINAYYEALVVAEFPPSPSSTSGRDTPVHRVLKAKLDRVAQLLDSRGLPSALKVSDIGGFDIRNNANNASQLSNHSFGWAVDLDPELNPNISKRNLPLDLISALTGLDLYGSVSEALRNPRPFDACLSDVTKFTDASATVVQSFRTLDSLKAATGAAIARMTNQTMSVSQLDAAFDAAANGQAAIRRVLAGASLAAEQATAVSKWLASAIRLFSLEPKVKKPEVTGNPGTVVRFGFCNLPAPLIAAMIATDGAGLNWLGAARSTKDFMHFDLLPADQPKLVT